MLLVLASTRDLASINIKNQILGLVDWEEQGEFDNFVAYRREDMLMVTHTKEHLFADEIDKQVEKSLGVNVKHVVFASRHKSTSGMRSLTLHPIGNYGAAEYGGRAGRLVAPSPHLMTQALRVLGVVGRKLNYNISFEVTHHGPWVSTPSFFVEIGSDAHAWKDVRAGVAVAKTILKLAGKVDKRPIAVGVGGPHYAPRFTDVALARVISFAHMVPRYQIENLNDQMIDRVIECSKARVVYFHRKGLKKSSYKRLKKRFENRGIKPVREKDLEPL